MINYCSNMIDESFEIINDMGVAPIVGAMVEILRIPETVNNFNGQSDQRKNVDTGTAIKALIINVLYGRTPLVHVEESFKHLDCDVLFGNGLKSSDFNDDCLGKALESLGNMDTRKLYSNICMSAMELHNIETREIHVDTTNVSVYGEYNSYEAKDFEITYGDPKSKRKEFKQLNIGLFVQQNGFPIGGNALSGNKSDVVWFREALDELNDTFSGDIYTMPICIFDAAGSNEDMFKKANNLSAPTIIRISDRFSITGEHILRAWEDNNWKIVNKNGEIQKHETDDNMYKINSYITDFDGFEWRLIVIYSSELKKLKESTAKRNFPKQKENLNKLTKKLANISFETIDKANKEAANFIKKNIKTSAPFKYEINLEERKTEKYAKRGKPNSTSEKLITIGYHVNISIGERDEELYNKWLKQESCFALISNVPKERCTDEELFREYKEQWVVEDKFKFLKQPVVLGPIWLQKPERIKGLVFVLLLAVIVNMYLCFRCARSLKGNLPDNSILKESEPDVKVTPETLVNEKFNTFESEESKIAVIEKIALNALTKTLYNQKLLTTDKRAVEKPTYKVIKKLLDPMKTVIKLDCSGNQVRKFAYRTEQRTLDLVVKLGFNPKIYLEQFKYSMDLWDYNKSFGDGS